MMQISSLLLLAVAGGAVQMMVPQDDVLPVYGCGAGCRIEVEQLSPVEDFGNGWRKVKVEKTTWIQVWNEETQRPEDGPPFKNKKAIIMCFIYTSMFYFPGLIYAMHYKMNRDGDRPPWCLM